MVGREIDLRFVRAVRMQQGLPACEKTESEWLDAIDTAEVYEALEGVEGDGARVVTIIDVLTILLIRAGLLLLDGPVPPIPKGGDKSRHKKRNGK